MTPKVAIRVLSIALALAACGMFSASVATPKSHRDRSNYQSANTSELLSKPNATGVKVGAYLDNIHDMSLQNRRFVGEGYYWLEWTQKAQDILDRNQIKSGQMVAIANQVDTWDSKVNGLDDEPERLANGNYYQQIQFSANLYIPEINLRRFPFETIELPIIIETDYDSLAIQNEDIVLIPDARKNELISRSAGINGYDIRASNLEATLTTYHTDWGLDNGILSYSGVALNTTLSGSPLPSLIKYFLPLFIVVGIVLLAPSLEGELGDIRLAIPSTGLLTLIFLQQAYQAEIPQLDYLTFLDWFYACGYVTAIGTFVLFVWGTNFYQRASNDDKARALDTINRTDLFFQLFAILATVIIGFLAWAA